MKATWVDVWYDRHTRSWVVQQKDDNGHQIGPSANYVYTRREALALKEEYLREIGGSKCQQED